MPYILIKPFPIYQQRDMPVDQLENLHLQAWGDNTNTMDSVLDELEGADVASVDKGRRVIVELTRLPHNPLPLYSNPSQAAARNPSRATSMNPASQGPSRPPTQTSGQPPPSRAHSAIPPSLPEIHTSVQPNSEAVVTMPSRATSMTQQPSRLQSAGPSGEPEQVEVGTEEQAAINDWLQFIVDNPETVQDMEFN